MSNLQNVVGPACQIITKIKEVTKKLKEGKEKLSGTDGNGGLDKELDDLKKLLEEKKQNLTATKNGEPSQKWEQEKVEKDDGTYYWRDTSTKTSSYVRWERALAAAEEAVEKVEGKIKEKEEEIKA